MKKSNEEKHYKILCPSCKCGSYNIDEDKLIWDPRTDGTKIFCLNCKKRFSHWIIST